MGRKVASKFHHDMNGKGMLCHGCRLFVMSCCSSAPEEIRENPHQSKKTLITLGWLSLICVRVRKEAFYFRENSVFQACMGTAFSVGKKEVTSPTMVIGAQRTVAAKPAK